ADAVRGPRRAVAGVCGEEAVLLVVDILIDGGAAPRDSIQVQQRPVRTNQHSRQFL
ncbi:hypothetical protein BGW38_000744, partial [Lunasporangiospora selenospora]